MDDADLRLDGNAAAGFLGEIFAFDVTTARAVCSGCGAVRPVAELMAYDLPLGVILRCPGCDMAMLRVSRLRQGHWIDMRGMRVLQVD